VLAGFKCALRSLSFPFPCSVPVPASPSCFPSLQKTSTQPPAHPTCGTSSSEMVSGCQYSTASKNCSTDDKCSTCSAGSTRMMQEVQAADCVQEGASLRAWGFQRAHISWDCRSGKLFTSPGLAT